MLERKLRKLKRIQLVISDIFQKDEEEKDEVEEEVDLSKRKIPKPKVRKNLKTITFNESIKINKSSPNLNNNNSHVINDNKLNKEEEIKNYFDKNKIKINKKSNNYANKSSREDQSNNQNRNNFKNSNITNIKGTVINTKVDFDDQEGNTKRERHTNLAKLTNF